MSIIKGKDTNTGWWNEYMSEDTKSLLTFQHLELLCHYDGIESMQDDLPPDWLNNLDAEGYKVTLPEVCEIIIQYEQTGVWLVPERCV